MSQEVESQEVEQQAEVDTSLKTPLEVAEMLANSPYADQVNQFAHGIAAFRNMATVLQESTFQGKQAARVADAIKEALAMEGHLKGQLKALQASENARAAAEKVAKKAEKQEVKG